MLFKKKEKFIIDGQQDVKKVHHWWQFKLFSSHYVIERFGIMIVVLSSAILLCLGYSMHRYNVAMNMQNTRRAKYTTQFKTSRSKLYGKVVGIYGNKRRTKAFVLLRADSAAQLPGDPKEYQFFLGGANKRLGYEKLSSKPSASFYMFGSTGYMGVYLVDQNGFKSQIVNLIGRINDPVSQVMKASKGATGTFRKYDQFQVFFNPGASHVHDLTVLNEKGAPSISDLYNGLILQKQEEKARRKLNADLAKLYVYQKQIQDRRHRLVMDHVKPLAGPTYIRGDKVYKKNGNLYLETKHTIPGGFNYDWQDGSVRDGYLNKLFAKEGLPANTDPDDYLAKKEQTRMDNTQDTSAESEDSYINCQPDDSAWKFFNGKRAISATDADVINDSGDDDDQQNTEGTKASREAQINNDIQLIESAWQKYVDLKIKYQQQDLEQLLQLESTYSQVDSISMINDSNKVLTLF